MDTRERDSRELAEFGYLQRLARPLGSFAAFAMSYGFVAVLTSVTALFFFGFAAAGPGFVWGYPLAAIPTVLVCLCLAELAGEMPLTGSLYQWTRALTHSRLLPWLTGWFFIAALLTVVPVIGPTLQAVLTPVFEGLQLVGGTADVGTSTTKGGALNAMILGVVGLMFTTIVNIIGVRWAARVAGAVVIIELIATCVMVVGFALNIHRGPGVIFESHGTGGDYTTGYFGALLVALMMGGYSYFGFESAATLAEEVRNPRAVGPKTLIRVLGLVVLSAMLLVTFALMAVPNIRAPELGTIGMPYVIQSTLGKTLGDILLLCVGVAVLGAITALQATAGRVIFAMARNNRLPFSSSLSRVSPNRKTPIAPLVVLGVGGCTLLILNYGNTRIFSTIAAVGIVLYYISYLFVVIPMLMARLRGQWPPARQGPYFSLGRWGFAVNVGAVVGTVALVIDIAWPRAFVYGTDHWYLHWGSVTVTAVLLLVGLAYYAVVIRHRDDAPRLEHSALVDSTQPADEPPSD
ncbi:MAG: APC family permease [Actinomycetota bacterium]|nr:APC family permease [Actinomycetota bacterium]